MVVSDYHNFISYYMYIVIMILFDNSYKYIEIS